MAQAYVAQGSLIGTLSGVAPTRVHPHLSMADSVQSGFVMRGCNFCQSARSRPVVQQQRSVLAKDELGRPDRNGGSSMLSPPQARGEPVATKPPQATPRRPVLLALCVTLSGMHNSYDAQAAESGGSTMEDVALDSIGSFLDPDELAPSGQKIPKVYKKHVREVVRTLKDSLLDQSLENRDIRRKADPAKEAIRNYIINWRGAKELQDEESYKALERVLRALGAFYQKAGPAARVPIELRQTILKDLELAEKSVECADKAV